MSLHEQRRHRDFFVGSDYSRSDNFGSPDFRRTIKRSDGDRRVSGGDAMSRRWTTGTTGAVRSSVHIYAQAVENGDGYNRALFALRHEIVEAHILDK